MGSPFQIIFYTSDSVTANRLANESYALVDSLNAIFSDYEQNSELNLLCATAGRDSFVAVSPALFDILSIAKNAWKKSDGAFDITVGPLSRLWRKARREKKFPDASLVSATKSKTGFDKIEIDATHHSVRLKEEGMQLDLGGIAAGYMAQKVVDRLNSRGVASALVNASGDIVCSNKPPDKQAWEVAVNVPGEAFELLDETIKVENKSVSTSGNVFQYIEHEGKKYSHIVDVKTGYGVTLQRNVTIIAPDGTTADWLATACSILPLSKAKKLVKKFHSDFLITELKGNSLVKYSTKGIKRYFDK